MAYSFWECRWVLFSPQDSCIGSLLAETVKLSLFVHLAEANVSSSCNAHRLHKFIKYVVRSSLGQLGTHYAEREVIDR